MKKNIKKIAAIIQARMTSTRLQGKVLMNIEDKPMLWHVINRLKFSKKLNNIILAIPDTKENDILERFAEENDIRYFRGSEEDVLFRYYEAARKFKVDVIVRITSDCPVIDPEVIDKVVEKHLETKADYTANVLKRTYPKGLDVEVMNFSALERSFKEAQTQSDREHVTLYLRQHPEKFKRVNVKNDKDLSSFRWTVDEKEDLEFIREVYKKLFQERKIFLTKKIVELLKKEPQLVEINRNVKKGGDMKIILEKASFSDIEFLWYLRNQPYVYKNSRCHRPVGWKGHINWIMPILLGFNKKDLFIVECSNKKAGQIRFDYKNNEAEVSISLLKEFCGKGIGSRALKLAIARIEKKVERVMAEIKKDNTASIKLFEKINFKQESQKGEWLQYVLKICKKIK